MALKIKNVGGILKTTKNEILIWIKSFIKLLRNIKCQHLNKQITEGEIQKAYKQNDASLEK